MQNDLSKPRRQRKLDFVSEEKRMTYLKEIIAFFQDERNEEIGFVAAEQVWDFFLESIGDEIYKRGVADAKKILKQKMEDLDIELDLLSENK